MLDDFGNRMKLYEGLGNGHHCITACSNMGKSLVLSEKEDAVFEKIMTECFRACDYKN